MSQIPHAVYRGPSVVSWLTPLLTRILASELTLNIIYIYIFYQKHHLLILWKSKLSAVLIREHSPQPSTQLTPCFSATRMEPPVNGSCPVFLYLHDLHNTHSDLSLLTPSSKCSSLSFSRKRRKKILWIGGRVTMCGHFSREMMMVKYISVVMRSPVCVYLYIYIFSSLCMSLGVSHIYVSFSFPLYVSLSVPSVYIYIYMY